MYRTMHSSDGHGVEWGDILFQLVWSGQISVHFHRCRFNLNNGTMILYEMKVSIKIQRVGQQNLCLMKNPFLLFK